MPDGTSSKSFAHSKAIAVELTPRAKSTPKSSASSSAPQLTRPELKKLTDAATKFLQKAKDRRLRFEEANQKTNSMAPMAPPPKKMQNTGTSSSSLPSSSTSFATPGMSSGIAAGKGATREDTIEIESSPDFDVPVMKKPAAKELNPEIQGCEPHPVRH